MLGYVTWGAVIAGAGIVLLLLWAMVFRGSSPPQQASLNERAGHGSAREAVEPTPRKPVDWDAEHAAGKTLDSVTLYASCRGAVATIVTKDDAGFDAGQGSGFFIARELVGTRYASHGRTEASGTARAQWAYLLTNYHVIRSAATAEVQLDDGRQGFILDVVMEQEDADLAVVFVGILEPDGSSEPTKPIGVLQIAEGQGPAVGQRVYAIGSPQGLDASLSEGIISGRREVAEGMWWLQTTAPISPGSSGGPLLDPTGHVVGVVTALRHGGQNLNFAVPASQVLTFLKGRCNSRKLWRGTGIQEEAEDAYSSAWEDTLKAKHLEKVDRPGGELLFKAHQQIGQKDYDGATETLAAIDPAQCGQFEYLLHYTIGRLAEHREYERLRDRRRLKAPKILTLEEAYEGARNDKDHQLAKASFDKAIELNTGFSPAYERLAECLAREGRFAEAFTVADFLVKRVPRCATAYALRGGMHAELKRHTEALADLETAAEFGPNNPQTYVHIAQVCGSLGESAKEIHAYETAIRLKSSVACMCYFNMGMTYQRMGRFEQALACFEQAKALGFPQDMCDEQMAKCRLRMR
ncbi:MAG: trypsin-like peptidase domain-containing protein [Thermoguttaceae bacterium]|nr:trypsin-like peptidase domain-containing protein [Thermoguttaceae bacterium]